MDLDRLHELPGFPDLRYLHDGSTSREDALELRAHDPALRMVPRLAHARRDHKRQLSSAADTYQELVRVLGCDTKKGSGRSRVGALDRHVSSAIASSKRSACVGWRG